MPNPAGFKLPCKDCGKFTPGAPFQPGDCYPCWRTHHDWRYGLMVRGHAQRAASAAVPVPGVPPPPPGSDPLPCRHFGAPTGETVDCPSCRGRVSLKLFHCAGPHQQCTPEKAAPGVACCASCPDRDPDTYSLVAPRGTVSRAAPWEGRLPRKPWHYQVTAVVPHLDTPDAAEAVIALLRLQSERPYILVIDTGSPPDVCARLEKLRHEDLEVHFVKGHGYVNSSGAVPVALDLAHSLCRTPYLFHTHSDCFPLRRDLIEWLVSQCSPECPIVGWEMSERSWATDEWRGIPSHTATAMLMDPVRRAGLIWSMELSYSLTGLSGRPTMGWPDTETGFGIMMKARGVRAKILGPEQNFALNIGVASYVGDTRHWYEHVRGSSGVKVYGGAPPHYRARQPALLARALASAWARAARWQRGEE